MTSASTATPAPRADTGQDIRADPKLAATLDVVQRTWAEFLEVDHIGPNDDFFEFGGNSLVVASAVALLGERVGLDLPMRALFAAPTPAEMAELVAELRAEEVSGPVEGTTPFFPEWVIPLQQHGGGRPVFLFPGGMGGIWILVRDAQVASLVGREHPFYGFRRDKPHVDPERADWVSQLAAAYIDQMRTIQGRGPYLLYAICSGGFVAWETVRQLLAAGEEIAGLLFYEVPLPSDFATRQSAAAAPPAALTRRYTPEPLPVDLTVLESEGWRAQGKSAAWREVVGGALETVVMPGESSGPHDPYRGRESMVAEQIRQWIARSESRSRL